MNRLSNELRQGYSTNRSSVELPESVPTLTKQRLEFRWNEAGRSIGM